MASKNQLLTASALLERDQETIRRIREKELQAKLLNLNVSGKGSNYELSDDEGMEDD